MSTKAQIEAAKKALEAGQGIGAAIDAAEAEAWQPIETAPKDTRIIFILNNSLYIGSFYSQFNQWVSEGTGFKRNPTHWRPLPAPPKTEE